MLVIKFTKKCDTLQTCCYANVNRSTLYCFFTILAVACMGPGSCLHWLCIKVGLGTRGQGHRDVCVGTWDLGMRDERLEDIKCETQGRVGRGRGDVKYRDSGDAGCE